jgi:signal transduction histidine kinase
MRMIDFAKLARHGFGGGGWDEFRGAARQTNWQIADKMTINSGIKLRLAALGLAAGLMGALIIVVTLNSQRQANELRARLIQVDSESFGIAGQFKDSLRGVNDTIRRYRTTHDPAAWGDFLKASGELRTWIEDQASRLSTQPEKKILQQMGAAFEEYTLQVQQLHTNAQAPEAEPALSEKFVDQSRHLADLGNDLAKAHFESRNAVIARANRTLGQLRHSVLWLLCLLFLFALGLAASVYYQLIAPLRTKLVESEALVERREKLASLGLLAAGVAHEIRNPLTAIKAALFIQQKRFRPDSNEFTDSKLVEREILRLERIVNDFLQFARPTEPEMATLSADQPLQEVQALLAPQLAKSGIELLHENAPPLQIKADPAQIKQVLINLVQNAADSIDRHGKIALRARHDRKRLHNGETDVVILEVADNGKGISPEVEKRLFDPFFTTKPSGTGLGLSIAARIVAQHGGALQYQTQVHRGTTFGIVLPQVAA